MTIATQYRGRFAPSPTGPLHFGSLIAAVGSYLQARSQNGQWLVRIDDLDPPREIPGASDGILRTLDQFGFEWDEEVMYQSQRSEAYLAALERLREDGLLYPCGCSRKEISDSSVMGQYGPIYNGLCRNGIAKHKRPAALRVITHSDPITFEDRLQGRFSQRIEAEIGDFVIRRADTLFAYQFAVVVDDADQKITEVVRGIDLLDNTPRQIHLQRLLGLAEPGYLHLPIALAEDGQKLSKQTGATALNEQQVNVLLVKALTFLGQQPPAELARQPIGEVWCWAIKHWQLSSVPASVNRPVSQIFNDKG